MRKKSANDHTKSPFASMTAQMQNYGRTWLHNSGEISQA